MEQLGQCCIAVVHNSQVVTSEALARLLAANAQLQQCISHSHPGAGVYLQGSEMALGVWDGVSPLSFTCAAFPPLQEKHLGAILNCLRSAGFLAKANLEKVGQDRLRHTKDETSLAPSFELSIRGFTLRKPWLLRQYFFQSPLTRMGAAYVMLWRHQICPDLPIDAALHLYALYLVKHGAAAFVPPLTIEAVPFTLYDIGQLMWLIDPNVDAASLATTLRGFFHYYGVVFDWNTNVASLASEQLKTKAARKWQSDAMCVEDPFELDKNLARGVTADALKGIVASFRKEAKVMENGNISVVVGCAPPLSPAMAPKEQSLSSSLQQGWVDPCSSPQLYRHDVALNSGDSDDLALLELYLRTQGAALLPLTPTTLSFVSAQYQHDVILSMLRKWSASTFQKKKVKTNIATPQEKAEYATLFQRTPMTTLYRYTIAWGGTCLPDPNNTLDRILLLHGIVVQKARHCLALVTDHPYDYVYNLLCQLSLSFKERRPVPVQAQSEYATLQDAIVWSTTFEEGYHVTDVAAVEAYAKKTHELYFQKIPQTAPALNGEKVGKEKPKKKSS